MENGNPESDGGPQPTIEQSGNTSAADGGSDFGDPGAYVRLGRGRHKKDCPCEKCAAKRDGGSGGGIGVRTGGPASGSGKSTPSARSTGKAAQKLDLTQFTSQIVGAHKILALVMKNPLWLITEEEARKLAIAVQDVMAFHSINVNPQVLAYVKLAVVVVSIYAPKFLMVMAQAKQQQKRGPIPDSQMPMGVPNPMPQQSPMQGQQAPAVQAPPAPARPYKPADPTQMPIPVGPMRFQ